MNLYYINSGWKFSAIVRALCCSATISAVAHQLLYFETHPAGIHRKSDPRQPLPERAGLAAV